LGRLRASDEPLRARVRHSISNFLLAVSRTGTLEGTTREAAASVTCGRTMTHNRFAREPDDEVIALRWRAALDEAPGLDLVEEARTLLDYLRQELRASEVFRPVLDSQSLDAIADASTASAASLVALERQLATVVGLLSSGYRDLSLSFLRTPAPIRDSIRDFPLAKTTWARAASSRRARTRSAPTRNVNDTGRSRSRAARRAMSRSRLTVAGAGARARAGCPGPRRRAGLAARGRRRSARPRSARSTGRAWGGGRHDGSSHSY
jgi:hypothetical protein